MELIKDEQWAVIKPFIPKPKKRRDGRGRPCLPARRVFEGILWILRTGAPWRYLPDCFPSYQTCHRRFQLWNTCGAFHRILVHLAYSLNVGSGEEAFIDGSYVPAKRGGNVVGRCCAGRATKMMALADSRGLPLSISIAEGSRHDVVLTDLALDSSFINTLPARVIGDKAWDSAKHQNRLLTERDIELIAPKKGGVRRNKRRQDGRSLRRARRRWKVERLFAWIKNFRRLSTRWEYKAENYLGMLYLGCLMILVRQH